MATVKEGRVAIVTAIVDVLKGVTGVEDKNVFTVWQKILTDEDFLDKFLTEDRSEVQHWLVRRIRTNPNTNDELEPFDGAIGDVWYIHTIEILFWFGYRDNVTEDTFQDLVDDVLEAFKNKHTLGGWSTIGVLGLRDRLTTTDARRRYCHFAQFEIQVVDPHQQVGFQ